jgi:hypothetical protein
MKMLICLELINISDELIHHIYKDWLLNTSIMTPDNREHAGNIPAAVDFERGQAFCGKNTFDIKNCPVLITISP